MVMQGPSPIESILPLGAVLVSLLAVPLIIVSRAKPNLREGWTLLAGAAKLVLVATMLPAVQAGHVMQWSGPELVAGVPFLLRVDALGMVFALVASSLWILTSIYTVGYMRGLKEHSQTRFFCFVAVALSSTIGVAFSGNLLTLFLFYELLSIATYPLVAHHQDSEARFGGRKYLTFIVGGSVGLVLPAMVLCYTYTGTLAFESGGILADAMPPIVAAVLLPMFVFGFAKAGVMPMHVWLPGAMVAPTPVSALLHAVAVVKVGVFSLLRVVTGIYGIDFLGSLSSVAFDARAYCAALAALTVVLSSLIALSQDGLKRRLAFSTIGQLGYIVLGALLLNAAALYGAVAHIAMHAFGKITLFFCAGAIYVAAKKKNVSEMRGLGYRMPVTFAAFLIGSLSVVGMPPAGGMLSKWYLLLGAHDAIQIPFVACYLASSLLGASYLFPVVFTAFLPVKGQSSALTVKEAPLCCLVPILLTAFASVLLFFVPGPLFELVGLAVDSAMERGG